jgi:hypothetical protein
MKVSSVLMPRKTTTPAAVYTVKAGDLSCFTLNKPPERLVGGSRRRFVKFVTLMARNRIDAMILIAHLKLWKFSIGL